MPPGVPGEQPRHGPIHQAVPARATAQGSGHARAGPKYVLRARPPGCGLHTHIYPLATPTYAPRWTSACTRASPTLEKQKLILFPRARLHGALSTMLTRLGWMPDKETKSLAAWEPDPSPRLGNQTCSKLVLPT
jgi:hypothetical protein